MSSDRRRERSRVREVSYDEIDEIREREYQRFAAPSSRRPLDESRTLVRVPSADLPVSRTTRQGDYEVDRIVRRSYLDVPGRDYEQREVVVRRRSGRFHDSSDDSSDSEDDRSRHRSRHGRARSAAAVAAVNDERDVRPRAVSRAEEKRAEDGGYLWYSHKRRCDANFAERHFDSSYDGIIAGVAGAAIGSITAARFGGAEHKTLKALGGALIGAAAFNTAENHYRVFTETREEISEKKEKIKERLHRAESAVGRALE